MRSSPPFLHVQYCELLAGQPSGLKLLLKKAFERLLGHQCFFGELELLEHLQLPITRLKRYDFFCSILLLNIKYKLDIAPDILSLVGSAHWPQVECQVV